MTVKSVVPGAKSSKFDVGNEVKTKSGLVGVVIGLAEYSYGWDYRVRFPNRNRTRYLGERELMEVK
jgi:hypothetical protein